MRTGSAERVVIRALDGSGVAEAVRSAAASLAAGRLVIAPTETVYGVFASAREAGALRALEEARDRSLPVPPSDPQTPVHTWHAGSAEAVERVVALPTPVHRRLVRGLMPGPVRLLIEQERGDLERICEELGVPAGILTTELSESEDGEPTGWVSVRVPDHRVARALIGACGAAPLVARRLGGTVWRDADRPEHRVRAGLDGGGDAGSDADGEGSGLDGPAFDGMILDGGTLPSRPPSTTVRLRLSGAFEVSEGGSVSEDAVMSALRRTILFVCTGNTCRSPMAEAIARAMVDARRTEDGTETVVASAGVMAGDGMPATPEAADAARALGGDLGGHRSRGLTRAMVDEAERVYVMTDAHGDRARALLGGAESGKIERLDPAGDIPDPIGGPPAVYRETAERIREAIGKRFEELGL